jgi:hypothetical protein
LSISASSGLFIPAKAGTHGAIASNFLKESRGSATMTGSCSGATGSGFR